jgi:hypothetical protein
MDTDEILANHEKIREETRKRFFDAAVDAHVRRRAQAPGVTTFGNIVGTGIGEKTTSGSLTGEPAIVVYVRRKVAKRRLRAAKIPEKINGVPTDVFEVGNFRFADALQTCQTNPEARQPRPFPAGVSVSSAAATAGSLGYRVFRPGAPEELILSNFHVLGDVNDPTARPDVFQPGRGDGQLPPADFIGKVDDAEPLVFGPSGANVMDAAVARLAVGTCLPALCRFGRLTGSGDPNIGDAVRIYGKRSRVTAGFVKDHVQDIVFGSGARTVRFVDQLLLVRNRLSRFLVLPGDSGSIALKPPATACALVFAASGLNLALATPIERILARFGVQIVA